MNKKSQDAHTAIVLLDLMITMAEFLSTNGGPSSHNFAMRIVKQCKTETGRQLQIHDRAIEAEE